MTKGTQLWPGDRMRAFFAAHIRRETSLDEVAAAKLAEALTRAVNRMMVWDGDVANSVTAATAPSHASATPAPDAFNAYAFSTIVVLVKFGRDALAKRLAEITSIEHLRAIADAQHLAVDARLKKADDLRKAIITATERRLADRKAAAG